MPGGTSLTGSAAMMSGEIARFTRQARGLLGLRLHCSRQAWCTRNVPAVGRVAELACWAILRHSCGVGAVGSRSAGVASCCSRSSPLTRITGTTRYGRLRPRRLARLAYHARRCQKSSGIPRTCFVAVPGVLPRRTRLRAGINVRALVAGLARRAHRRALVHAEVACRACFAVA